MSTDTTAQRARAAAAGPIVASGGGAEPGLAALLQYEAELRRQSEVAELVYFIANETRRLVPYDQCFVLRRALLGGAFHVVGVSSISVVDRTAPLIQDVEAAAAALDTSGAAGKPGGFDAAALVGPAAFADYPYREWWWQPLLDREGAPFAALLLAATTPLRGGEAQRLERVAETSAHAWRALTRERPAPRTPRLGKRERQGIAALIAVVALFPVRISALAPVEVVPARPFVVAAPFSGVVAEIDVPPNAPVRKGQKLLSFEDVKLRNEYELAAEKLKVARARVDRSASVAFDKADESRDVAIMQAEFDLAQAEYDYAGDMLSKTQVAAPRAGLAIYGDPRDWEGRAVTPGETIMQIADPDAVAFRIELPAAEQMALARGAPVKVWLNSQPLWALDGVIERASYQARPNPDNVLAFAVTARPVGRPPRIGARGTARVYGRWVPLSYSILRRPIAGLRQWIGM